ncbi:MAG TPA: TolC family protein [Longimicrobium sp.]|uniref:TolC family protein n=1 Tax=Longimicrobium sp. TaxID=2029185 RepID=UPI002ED87C98
MPKGTFSTAVRGVAVMAALTLAGAPRAAAQTTPGLTLDDVVRRAAAHGPQANLVRAAVDAVYARTLTASAPFDTHLAASVAGGQESGQRALSTGLSPFTQHTTEYALQASRRLRSGIVLQPQVNVRRTSEVGVAAVDAASGVSLGVMVPLMRDRMARASGASARGLAYRAAAGPHDIRYGTEVGAGAAAAAYWDYAAACARLEVFAEAERRAARRLEETRVLVRGDERPAAELNPLQAAVSRARVQRIGAEQAVDEARIQLGIALGMGTGELGELGTPVTPFPKPEAWTPDAAERERVVRLALERRGDVVGTRLELTSDEVLLAGARENLKPQLDLHLNVGYTGRQLGGGLGGLVQPLYRDVPGMNASVQVQYQIPVARTEARGQSAAAEAARLEKSLRLEHLEREVSGSVLSAMLAVSRGSAALVEADRAVALYRVSVNDEQQKNRLGVSTLLDVTYAEDNLTNALLASVNSRMAYAKALSQLRVNTGTLAREVDGGLVLDAALLLTRP